MPSSTRPTTICERRDERVSIAQAARRYGETNALCGAAPHEPAASTPGARRRRSSWRPRSGHKRREAAAPTQPAWERGRRASAPRRDCARAPKRCDAHSGGRAAAQCVAPRARRFWIPFNRSVGLRADGALARTPDGAGPAPERRSSRRLRCRSKRAGARRVERQRELRSACREEAKPRSASTESRK